MLMTIGGSNTGDVIIPLVFLIIQLALVVGIILLVIKFSKKNNQLDKTEVKIDKIQSGKEK